MQDLVVAFAAQADETKVETKVAESPAVVASPSVVQTKEITSTDGSARKCYTYEHTE